MKKIMTIVAVACACRVVLAADPPSPGGFPLRSEATAGQVGGQAFPKPYSAPCVERENVFEFTEKPAVKNLGNDKYEITFGVKANCDVTVGIVDSAGVVVRHLAAGVLGANAPLPFQKNSLKQTIYWNGKDDLDVYHKEPGKLKVRVMLGLKPEFDKRLGGTSPYNTPGHVWGLAADETGVYVFHAGGWDRVGGRKFDHDGKYLQTVIPPPANLPESKFGGLGYVEYEPGKKAPQGRDLYETTASSGIWLSQGMRPLRDCKPFAAAGKVFYGDKVTEQAPSRLRYILADGGTDAAGATGLPLPRLPVRDLTTMRIAATPDGKTVYWVCSDGDASCPAVGRAKLDGTSKAERFLGDAKWEPGSDERRFQSPCDVDCDAQGRVYVADRNNNRVQIFGPDGPSAGSTGSPQASSGQGPSTSSGQGKLLRSLAVERPSLLAVHKRTGALYVYHGARVEGKSLARLSKFTSWEASNPELYFDGIGGYSAMALDSWAPKPRFWFGGGVVVWEEDGGKFKKILDFAEEAKKEDGAMSAGQIWSANISSRVVCDPSRELVYFQNSLIFDLHAGKPAGRVALQGGVDDFIFDKRGYMHCHFNPSGQPGVGRVDPTRSWVEKRENGGQFIRHNECPYDYGVEGNKDERWKGIIPVRDQLGAKFFQDGVGVNMRGDVVEQSNIYYVPKMEDEGTATAMVGAKSRSARGEWCEEGVGSFLRSIEDAQKRGEEVYSIRREPGIPLSGATAWTYEKTGELRQDCAANMGELINGVQIDEDGQLYFVVDRQKAYGGKPFLADKAGHFGEAKRETAQFGTLMKTAGKGARCILPNAPVRLDEMPNRPKELTDAWVEGAEWLYAGASPITFGSCSCPTMRFSTDWYKRTFVPEAYRHSIGVVDTAGNLILHIGQYGNFDSGDGAKSKIPVGGDNIGIAFNEMVSTTDNYLVFEDFGERLTVLKLNYHAEETVGIGNQ